MNTKAIREELQDYITKADDRFIKLIYGMMSADRDENIEVPESQKKIILSRLKDYKNNPDDVLSWEEVQKKIKSKL